MGELDHFIDEQCPYEDCGDELYHQNMGRGESPAIVCISCDWTSWSCSPCEDCDIEIWVAARDYTNGLAGM